MGSPFDPNEVPAPVYAAALSGSLTEGVRSWHGITFGRLMKDSRCVHQNITQEIEIYFSDIIAQAR